MAEFEIGTKKKYIVLVDDEDLVLVSKFRWCPSTTKMNKTYATTRRPECIGLHRLVMGTVGTKLLVDHINHNGLDNRKSNLRVCTKSQNCSNRRSARGSSSKYLGVAKSFSKNVQKWTASVSKMKKVIHYGRFDSEIEAAKAYNEWAKEVHGEFANLNIIEENG